MNFDDAVSAHQKWRIRLLIAIEGKSTERLDPNIVCRDDQCELGKWIYGDGSIAMETNPEFEEIKSAHNNFHKVVGDVLRMANAGDRDGASKMLDEDYYQASSEVIRAITNCKAICK